MKKLITLTTAANNYDEIIVRDDTKTNEVLITTDRKFNDISTVEFLKEVLKRELFKNDVYKASVRFLTEEEKECNFDMIKATETSYKMDAKHRQVLFITDEDRLDKEIEDYADTIADLQTIGYIPV